MLSPKYYPMNSSIRSIAAASISLAIVISCFSACNRKPTADLNPTSNATPSTAKKEKTKNEVFKIPKIDQAKLREKVATQQQFHEDVLKKLTDEPGNDLRSLMDLAGHYFMSAQFKECVKKYDQVIAMNAAYQPNLWQRGLALYYADEFQTGVEQFEIHQTVNTQDVENSVWHLLCASKTVGLEKARESMIDIKADTRVPMKEIHQLFAGKLKPAEVVSAAELAPNPTARQYQLYYAYLYLALYFEMTEQPDQCRGCLENAIMVGNLPIDVLMGQVARVHYQIRYMRDSEAENKSSSPSLRTSNPKETRKEPHKETETAKEPAKTPS